MNTDYAKNNPVEVVLEDLSTQIEGISDEQAQQLLKKYGPNELVEKHVHPILKFIGYFWGPIPWMIEVAAILSAVIQHWEDFGVILTMLLINAGVGFWQEHKADTAIELLKKKLALKARVKRNGKLISLPAKNLVPGDIVSVRLGEIIPADIKLIEGEYLLVDESALTGESLPVEKRVSEIGYSGAVVKQGEMDAVVVATGMHTYFGRTAKLVEKAKSKSHFQQAVVKIGNYLISIAVIMVGMIFIVGIIRDENILDILQFALILVVASIPVALPAVLTVTMAVGATLLAKKDAIVSKLVAIEEMAGVDILCSDKTGTITKGKLAIKDIRPFKGFTESDVILFGLLASREESQDAIDDAVIQKSRTDYGIVNHQNEYQVTNFKPFDPVSKKTEAMIEGKDGSVFKVVKGAPQVVLELVSDKDAIRDEVDKQVNRFAKSGSRALGVAKTDAFGRWQYAGLLSIYDEPREDSAETIAKGKSMGLDIKMITGDHAAVAQEIAGEVGLSTHILPPSAFLDKHEHDAKRVVEKADGFAQVFPEHKYQIVDLLQKRNHIVGMTGDGVNDAPALKKSDCGIAVEGATDAAKSAAAIVLTKPGLSVIIDAIKESRKIFQRMNSYTIYRMAETIRVLLFMTLSIVVFHFYPVTAIMIVILALLNDIPIMMIAYDNTKIYPSPVRWNMSSVLKVSSLLGTIGVFASFFLFWLGEYVLHLDRQTLQTLIFLKLVVAGHMTIYLARTGKEHFWQRPFPALALFITTEITQVIATLFAVYGILMHPLGWTLAAFVWAYAFMFFVFTDFVKFQFSRSLHFSATNPNVFHHGVEVTQGVK